MGEQTEFTLRDYVNIFLRRWWLVALATIVSLGLAVIWTSQQTPMYRSTATVLVNQSNASDIFDPLSGTSGNNAGRLAENEARFVRSSLVHDEAVTRLGYEAKATVSTDTNADVLDISGTSDDPAQAQKIAQVYAETYIDVRKEQFVAERLETASKLFGRIEELDAQIAEATGADKARLELQRGQLADSFDLLSLTASLAEGTGAQIIDAADRPGEPYTPLVGRNIVLGGVLGLLVGSGLVLMAESLDRSVKTREVLEALTPGAPNLAIIPSLGKLASRPESLVALHDTPGTSAEAFRTLRAALQYVAVDDSVSVIQIVSAHSAAGKTTVAANLAITMAQAGQRVAVVDADLRRPRLHQLFGVPQVPGLTSAIIGAATIEQCVHHVHDPASPVPYVVPSGPVPPGPSELLGSAAGARVFDQIRALVDVVIVDTPPVLPVADTIVLSRYVDASVLVVDAQSTTRADVVLAYERLEQAGAPVIGTVLNRVKGRGAFGYGYGYGYSYGEAGDESARGLMAWFSGRNKKNERLETITGAQMPRIELAPKTPKLRVTARSGSTRNGAGPSKKPTQAGRARQRVERRPAATRPPATSQPSTPAATAASAPSPLFIPSSASPASPPSTKPPSSKAGRAAERRAAVADAPTAGFVDQVNRAQLASEAARARIAETKQRPDLSEDDWADDVSLWNQPGTAGTDS